MGVLKRWTGTEWEIVGRNPPEVNMVDLTNATTDYLLAVGETAFLDYVNATSVPLHVATQEGLYEARLIGSLGTVSVGGANLLPNNASYTGAMKLIYWYSLESSVTGGVATSQNSINIASGYALDVKLEINTKTTCKITKTNFIANYTGNIQKSLRDTIWNDTTTPWISLGTVTFDYAHTGRILIKRII